MAGETEKVTVELEVTGQQQTSAAFKNAAENIEKLDKEIKNVSKSAKASQAAFDSTKKAANDNANAFDEMAKKAQRVTPAFSAVGAAVSRLSPELGGLATAVGRAGGAMSGMTAIIGGVGGIVAGTLVAGLGLLMESLRETKTLEEQLAESVARTNEEFEKQYNSATKIADRLRDADARRRNEERRRGMTWKDFAESVTDPSKRDFSKSIEQDREEFERIRSGYGEGAIIEQEKGKQERARGGFGYRSQDDIQEQLKRLDAMARAPTLDERAEAGKEHTERRKAEFQSVMDHHVEVSRQADKEIEKSSQTAYGNMSKMGREAFAAIGQSAVTLAGQVASGQKITAKEVLMGIGTQLVGLGTTWLFEGDARVAESYGLDGSGYALNAIGGGAVAAGLAMMAGSVAAGAGRGGGGRGGGISRPRAAPDDPHWQTDTRGGRSTQNINVYQQNLVGDARAGQEVVKAIQQAQRQGLVTGNGMAA